MKEEEKIPAKIVIAGGGTAGLWHLRPDMIEKEIELHYARQIAPPMVAMANAMARSYLSKSENKVASMSDFEILRHHEQIKLKASKLSSTERKLVKMRAEKIINQNPLT